MVQVSFAANGTIVQEQPPNINQTDIKINGAFEYHWYYSTQKERSKYQGWRCIEGSFRETALKPPCCAWLRTHWATSLMSKDMDISWHQITERPKKQERWHLLHVDDAKLFAPNDKKLAELKLVKRYSDDIQVEFGIDKHAKCTFIQSRPTKTANIKIDLATTIQELDNKAS